MIAKILFTVVLSFIVLLAQNLTLNQTFFNDEKLHGFWKNEKNGSLFFIAKGELQSFKIGERKYFQTS